MENKDYSFDGEPILFIFGEELKHQVRRRTKNTKIDVKLKIPR